MGADKKQKQAVCNMEGGAEVVVFCSHDDLVPLEKLTPNPRNPNKHPDSQIALLAKIIAAQGWRAPITVSKRSGFIVAGHARLAAAQVLKLDVAPVDYQDFADEASEWAHMIADNRIAELAELDFEMLSGFLQELRAADFDITLLGMPEHEIETLLAAEWRPPAIEAMASHAAAGKGIHFTEEQYEVVQRAIAKVRSTEGDEPSDGRCIELVCASFLA